jgi:hypothetical protein
MMFMGYEVWYTSYVSKERSAFSYVKQATGSNFVTLLAYSVILKIEAVRASDPSVDFY